MNSVTLAWAVEIGIITFRTMSGESLTITTKSRLEAPNFMGPLPPIPSMQLTQTGVKRPPLPSELLSTLMFGVYAIIGNVGSNGPHIANLLAWGTVLATALSLGGAKKLPGQSQVKS